METLINFAYNFWLFSVVAFYGTLLYGVFYSMVEKKVVR